MIAGRWLDVKKKHNYRYASGVGSTRCWENGLIEFVDFIGFMGSTQPTAAKAPLMNAKSDDGVAATPDLTRLQPSDLLENLA
jgi:hypothetical protein